jgi:hypothetical protein
MKILVDSNCPFCSRHGSYEVRDEKNTIRCLGCSRPFELRADGRVEKSMLYEVMGDVRVKDDHGPRVGNVCTSFGGGKDHVQTRVDDMKNYGARRVESLSAKGEQ